MRTISVPGYLDNRNLQYFDRYETTNKQTKYRQEKYSYEPTRCEGCRGHFSSLDDQ